MSELLDKQVNAQNKNLKKTSRVHSSSIVSTQKLCDENERNKQTKKTTIYVCKNSIDGRRAFIGHVWKSSIINCKEPQVDDC